MKVRCVETQLGCGEVHCWRIATLWHQKAFAIDQQKPQVKSSPAIYRVHYLDTYEQARCYAIRVVYPLGFSYTGAKSILLNTTSAEMVAELILRSSTNSSFSFNFNFSNSFAEILAKYDTSPKQGCHGDEIFPLTNKLVTTPITSTRPAFYIKHSPPVEHSVQLLLIHSEHLLQLQLHIKSTELAQRAVTNNYKFCQTTCCPRNYCNK